MRTDETTTAFCVLYDLCAHLSGSDLHRRYVKQDVCRFCGEAGR